MKERDSDVQQRAPAELNGAPTFFLNNVIQIFS